MYYGINMVLCKKKKKSLQEYSISWSSNFSKKIGGKPYFFFQFGCSSEENFKNQNAFQKKFQHFFQYLKSRG